MIYGIGVDGVDMARMAKSLARPRFVQRVFGEGERALLAAAPNARARCQTAAGCFAAKEAFLKANGLGLYGFALAQVQALRAKSGQPYYSLSGAAAAHCAALGLRAHLSITHEGGLALAFAVLEKDSTLTAGGNE